MHWDAQAQLAAVQLAGHAAPTFWYPAGHDEEQVLNELPQITLHDTAL